MPTEFYPHGVRCAPCVAPLLSAAERLENLRDRLSQETDPLVTVTHLLHLCRDDHAVLWEQAADPRLRARISAILKPVRAVAASRPAGATLDPPVRRALAHALAPVDGVAPVMIAHELAQFLDHHYGQFLTDSFRRRSPYQPGVGDPVPLGGPDIRAVIDMQPTSPPWRLANRLDETRRVRLAGGWATQFRVVFDYSLFEALAGVITADTIIATAHPNRALSEFTLPQHRARPAFPIRPTNPRRQHLIIDRLIGGAVDAGASIVVLPELCVTESLARKLYGWVQRDDGPRLLVAGSYHHNGGAPRRRRNTAIAWVRGHQHPLIHDKHSAAKDPIVEDIQPQGWPEMRVYISADGWRLVLAVCRDLLNPQAVHALTEAGANLVLVPAMSERLTPFTGQITHLVSSGQALVAVANNPAEWAETNGEAAHRPARAMFGHPGLGQQVRLVTSSDTTPGIATMHVRSALIGWRSTDHDGASTRFPPDRPASATAPWAQSLATTLQRRYQPPQFPKPVLNLRPAAVLVLLTDGPAGPRVLLTERATDLDDYPGRLTFPGGAWQPDDTGPQATALREAGEEVGLDPASVHLLGVLPALTDPQAKFLVTPVLAWSAQPEYSGPVNLAEVTSVHEIDLREFGAQRPDPSETGNDSQRPTAVELHRLGALTATVIDMLLALLDASGVDTCAGGVGRERVWRRVQPNDE